MISQDQRPHFYEGQYLGADDLNAIVDNAAELAARHQLAAHGWGISTGLTLVERATPGPARRVSVFLTPGVAADGFGRQLTVLAPAALPEALFAGIAYAADLDDSAANNGTPRGRAVKVWLVYDEQPNRAPEPGFESCDDGGGFARLQRGARFVIGDQPSAHRVSLAGRMIDAATALQGTFDPQAPLLADESVPQQMLPLGDPTRPWPVPIGIVRWVASRSGEGYFVSRDVDPQAGLPDAIRRFRRYTGAVAATIQAPDGAIVLRDRLAPPVTGAFGSMLQSSTDLVWVEGNLRTIGDARLAGGALRFGNAQGDDLGTPLSIERFGDAGQGGRALRVVVGDADPYSRFAVCAVPYDPDPAKRVPVERFAVLANGNVGIATAAPAQRLHVLGERIRLENAGKIVDIVATGTRTGIEAAQGDMKLSAARPHSLLLNAEAGDGNVGIGTASPGAGYKLDVRARQIKLGLEEAGGGQLVLEGIRDAVALSALNAAGDASASAITIGGQGTQPVAFLRMNARSVRATGDELVLQDASGGKRLKLRTDGSEVDLHTDSNALSLRAEGHDCLINWFPGDGNVGIGLSAPQAKLHVKGDFVRIDGLGDECAYIGGDGHANDVQIGSFNPQIASITCINGYTNRLMTLHAANVSILSDGRLKTNVRELDGCLAAVAKLRGVRFDWRHDGGARDRANLGFLAQEVQEVLPEAVEMVRDQATISYTALLPVLVEAIKELKRENEAIRAELRALAQPRARPRAPRRTKALDS